MLSVAYTEALVEVLSILEVSPKEEVNKIPKKLIQFFTDHASTTYTYTVDKQKPIAEMSLKRETRSLLSMLYRNYLCTPEERVAFDNILKENQAKHDAEMKEKYNPDNIFQNTNVQEHASMQNVSVSENQQLVPYKESFLSRILHKIKSFFKR